MANDFLGAPKKLTDKAPGFDSPQITGGPNKPGGGLSLGDLVAPPNDGITEAPNTTVIPGNPDGINSPLPPPTAPPPVAPPPPAPPAPPPVIGNKIIGDEIKAKTGDVTDDMLVANQLAKALGENSPYVAQARARAMQTANSRGMMNSSLAAQGGEEAAIAAAMPIAQQDASTYFTNQRDNLAAQNQYGLADKNASLQDILQGRDLENRYRIAKENNDTQLTAAQMNLSAAAAAANANREIALAQLKQQGDQFAATLGFNRDQLNANLDEAKLTREWNAAQNQLGRDTQLTLANLNITAGEKQQLANLQQNTLVNFNAQMSQIFSSQMSAEDKDKAYRNLLAGYTGSPYFAYQPAPGAYPPPPPPAPAPPPPNANPSGNGA